MVFNPDDEVILWPWTETELNGDAQRRVGGNRADGFIATPTEKG